MIVVDLDRIALLVAFAGVVITLFGYLQSMRRDARRDIADLGASIGKQFNESEARTDKRFNEVRGEIAASEGRTSKRLDELRAETRDGFAKVGAQLGVLEARTYDLGRVLPPPPVEPHAS